MALTTAQIWSYGTRTLTDPDSYKADVSALALEATLTAIKGTTWSTETLKAINDAIVALNNIAQSDILSDTTPFAGADVALIKAYVDEVESILKDATYGLSALNTDLDAVEAKLDVRLDDTVTSRASSTDVEAKVENAEDSGNLTHDITTANDTAETQIVEIIKTGIYALSMFIDLDVLETTVEGDIVKIRLYNKIDGANYSDKPSAYIEYFVGNEDIYPSIEIAIIHGNCKLTIQCSSDVTATRTIAYRYIVRDLGA